MAQNRLEHTMCFKLHNKPCFMEVKFSFLHTERIFSQGGNVHTLGKKKRVHEPPFCHNSEDGETACQNDFQQGNVWLYKFPLIHVVTESVPGYRVAPSLQGCTTDSAWQEGRRLWQAVFKALCLVAGRLPWLLIATSPTWGSGPHRAPRVPAGSAQLSSGPCRKATLVQLCSR